jgi:hypothetical protein
MSVVFHGELWRQGISRRNHCSLLLSFVCALVGALSHLIPNVDSRTRAPHDTFSVQADMCSCLSERRGVVRSAESPVCALAVVFSGSCVSAHSHLAIRVLYRVSAPRHRAAHCPRLVPDHSFDLHRCLRPCSPIPRRARVVESLFAHLPCLPETPISPQLTNMASPASAALEYRINMLYE